ncbi:DNA repair protein RecO [Endomicrobium proavitum]|uniref:DNA repair protein RecO n=1 Tax=Endomicrobium proavitum TaxID=1408281 RepID=A0A0G3WI62_9BACT|nr:DNA repair protein RecO [Endomicrobium proavitum]AKL97978.1 DNA repair protein RecO [Endomicrobium proavitum]
MYYQIKALVLNSSQSSESDKHVTLYTYQWGKVKAVVPSAKKIAAKLNAATEPLTESELMVFQNHQSVRPKVTGAQIINNNSKIKTDFKRNLYALYACEVCDKLAPFNFENSDKYELLARVWEVLADCKFPQRAVVAFVLRFLKLSGYGFADYLKNNASLDKNTELLIRKLSNCRGEDVDNIGDIDDNKIWLYVETYLTNYVKRPSVGVFLKKINLT